MSNNFVVEYKVNSNQKNWDTMCISFQYFNSNWDEDRIWTEILEYLYTDNRFDDDDDYETNCIVKDMPNYVNKVKNYLKKEEELDKINKEEFYQSF
jgi:hypothetical protein